MRVAPGALRRLNPLAKVAAVVPAWIVLLVAREPAVALSLTVGAVLVVLVGARPRGRTLALLLVGLPAAALLMTAGFALWGHPAGAVLAGLTTALRITALVALALIGGLTTTGPDFARALTAQLRIPYRFSYTAVAAYRFVPRFAADAAQLGQALRLRGVAPGRGTVAAVRRASAAAVPLIASSIRHADRVALAMESRAFGAHPTRTERRPMRWRAPDTVFVALCWAATAALLVVLP
ncbi:energy-coupling factor transporter transmembrane component T [Leifsonia shinshuensis]|uniref:energy-coupling factor transporter transmembrane component T n=1 Tax=Leifsonia shinshuensis TaxID=150026 RepID=UPI0028653C8B|nr:energy-coupling factor transporter transmembrane component T [Leifsonia shinshuensis]MDR6972051.1 energy-coupling factor transporter transmembrane protein EcfT [Leifsonia shinshuensis]